MWELWGAPMSYTATQLKTFYTNLHMGKVPSAVQQLAFEGYAAQNQTGGLTDAQTLKIVTDTGDNDTAVAVLTYQFFTGKIPSAAGMDYLVDSAGNTSDLNDAYYANFNLENRYINFASNLGIAGEGAAAFAASYGPLTFDQTVDLAYEKIIGSSFATQAGIDATASKANIKGRLAYFQALANANFPSANAATKDLAVKAGVIGYIMAEAMKADIGVYAIGANAFMADLALDGAATFATDLVASYSVPASSAALAKSFTLTAANDIGANFAGSSGDDTFYADLTGTNQQTLNNGDIITGGSGGMDTLIATIKTDVTPAGLAGIDVVMVTNVDDGVGGGPDLNLTNAADIVSVRTGSNADPNGISITNIANAVKDFQVSNNSTAVTFQVKASALAGTDDSAVLTVDSVTGGFVTIGSGAAGSGYETLEVKSVGGTANVLGAVIDGASDKLTAFKFSGDQDLTITGSFDAIVKTFDASAMKGDLKLNLGAAAVVTATGGEGDDTFDFGGSYVGGASGASRDTVNGGDGVDTVALTSATATALSGNQANVTNVERLLITDALGANLDTTLFAGVTEVAFASTANGFTVLIDSGDTASFLASTVGPILTVSGFALNDTAAVKIGANQNLAFLQTTGIETLTVHTDGVNVFTVAMTATAAAETLKITGSGALTMGGSTFDVLDASGMDAGGSLFMAVALATAVAVTGSAGNDQLAGSNFADILVAGAGDDTIYGLNGIDLIDLGGGGKDIVVLATTISEFDRDNIAGFTVGTGADADTVQIASALTSAGTLSTANPVFQDVATAPGAPVAFTTGTADVLEFSFNLAGAGLAGSGDGTALLAALGQPITVAANTHQGYIIAYQGGNAYLYYAADVVTANSTLAANEIHLVGTFSGVAVGGFEASNIDLL